MSTSLRIDARVEGGETAVLSLAGDVDVASTQQVKDAALKLMSQGARNLVMDVSDTEYLDSAGLGMMVGLLKRVKERGGAMAVAGAKGRVKYVFEITHLDLVLTLSEDVRAALKEVGQASKEIGQ
jgi:anti-sigma B factor antagonist